MHPAVGAAATLVVTIVVMSATYAGIVYLAPKILTVVYNLIGIVTHYLKEGGKAVVRWFCNIFNKQTPEWALKHSQFEFAENAGDVMSRDFVSEQSRRIHKGYRNLSEQRLESIGAFDEPIKVEAEVYS